MCVWKREMAGGGANKGGGGRWYYYVPQPCLCHLLPRSFPAAKRRCAQLCGSLTLPCALHGAMCTTLHVLCRSVVACTSSSLSTCPPPSPRAPLPMCLSPMVGACSAPQQCEASSSQAVHSHRSHTTPHPIAPPPPTPPHSHTTPHTPDPILCLPASLSLVCPFA